MDNEGRVRSLRGLTVLGQQGCRQKGPGLIQHGRKAVPVQPFFLKTDHQLCDSPPLPCRQQTAQLHARLRAFLFHGDGGMELQLHAPGTERLQDHGRIFRTEEECRVGWAFLYDLQQYVLVLLCQNGAVRKDIDLPGTLVGPDIGIGADLADGVHGEVLMGLVPDGDNVRMNAGEHLAAGGTCPACRKVFSGIHPDVITVRDEAHKNLSVDTVRQIRADAYIRPNEGARKVYIFPDCTILTEQDQNVLLKIVEEGPPYAAFLFCAENSSVVLQTLRSRCVELKLHPAVTVEKESSEAGVELCRLLAAGKRGTVTELMVRLEKKRLDRDGLAAMLDQARTLLAAALLAQYGQSPEGPDAALIVQLGKRLTKQRIMGTIELLQTYRGACSYNVGASHVLGALAVELEEIL